MKLLNNTIALGFTIMLRAPLANPTLPVLWGVPILNQHGTHHKRHKGVAFR